MCMCMCVFVYVCLLVCYETINLKHAALTDSDGLTPNAQELYTKNDPEGVLG